jgi:delta8-fatty-acid desaturase
MGKGGCKPTIHLEKEILQNSTESRSNLEEISLSLLSTKNTVEECWIAYEGIVYDVTHWLPRHPGGVRAIMSAAGSESTAVMRNLHAPDTLLKFMKRIRKVGVLVPDNYENEDDSKKDEKERSKNIQKDFEILGEKLKREGWYEPAPMTYWAPITRAAAFLICGMSLALWTKGEAASEFGAVVRWLALIGGSILIGLFLQNIAFMGHDAGHGSITGDFALDAKFGLFLGNFFTGIDMGWWKSTHNVHHSATNSLHDDPDIQHMPLFCFDERMRNDIWSTYHGRYMVLDALGKLVLPYQHWYFYPVMGFARVNLHIQSIIYLIQTCPLSGNVLKNKGYVQFLDEKTGDVKEKYAWPKPTLGIWTASVTGITFYMIMFFKFLSVLGLYSALISFCFIYLTSGILHVQILLSHVAMDYCITGHGRDHSHDDTSVGYYEWQALSTMDVECPPWLDWFHGGLQFQLEHHLFPRVPRRNLRKLMKLTDQIFHKHNVPVIRRSFYESNKMILKHMAAVGANVVKSKHA